MRASDMRSRIRIESRGKSTDSEYGSSTETWLPFAEVWASIEDVLPARGESKDHGLRLATGQARIRMRYREGIQCAMRVVELNGMRRTFQITTAPAMTKWREELEFMAESYSS